MNDLESSHGSNMARLLVSSLALAVAWGASALSAADWPRWRGPDGNGISTESDWDPTALTDPPRVRWRVEVGKGHSCPVVKGQRVYTIGNDDGKDTVFCFDAVTGQEVWRRSHQNPAGHDHPGPRATPVVHGNSVYTLHNTGVVQCLGVLTGSVRWWRDLGVLGAGLPRWGFAGSPLIHGDAVILNAGQHGIALHKWTGKTLWSSAPGTGGYASLVLAQQGDRPLAAIFGEKSLLLVDVSTGTRLGSFWWETRYDVNAADPVVSRDRVFISSGYGKGGALIDVGGEKPKAVWTSMGMRNHFASSVLIDGHLYGIDGDTGSSSLACLRFSDGKRQWSKRAGFETLMAADGKLIILDSKGNLVIAEAVPSGYREIARAKVLGGRGAKHWTAPVLANGFIYCRNSKGDLACVDVRRQSDREGTTDIPGIE